MRILMLTPYLPYPPASGGQIRTLNLLKYLNKNNHITLISLYKNAEEKQYASYLKPYCDEVYLCKRPERPWQMGNVLKAVFSFLPFLIVRNYSSEAAAKVRELLKKETFDVIHAETFYIMPHIPQTSIPVLLVEQTIEFKVYQHFISKFPFLVQLPFYFDIVKLRYWETFYWKKAALTAAVSTADQDMINKVEPTIKTVIIPNGAGDEMFVENLQPKDISQPILLFVGNFFWLQNIEAAQYIIDKLLSPLKEKIPNVKLIIAGQNAQDRLQNTQDKHIEVINVAPDDSQKIKELYRQATLFIAPIFGPGGTRLKILAAMASGLPVVATKTGMEGLQSIDGEHVLIASNPETFIKNITTILSDKTIYEKLRKNAYQLAKEKFSWSSIARELEDVYKTIHTSP